MENLSDYSNYVMLAYIASCLVIIGFSVIVLTKYFALKKHKNEK